MKSHGIIKKHISISISKKRFVLDCMIFNGDVKKNNIIVVMNGNSTGQCGCCAGSIIVQQFFRSLNGREMSENVILFECFCIKSGISASRFLYKKVFYLL